MSGIIIGFMIALPIGPMAMLCIQKTLTSGWKKGLSIGIGIALADGTYALLAALGWGKLIAEAPNISKVLQWIGAVILIYLGVSILKKSVSIQNNVSKNLALDNSFGIVASFLLTLSNPMTILSFVAIYALFCVKTLFQGIVMAITVTIGSLLWWGILILAVIMIKHQLSSKWIKRGHQLSAIFLILLSIKCFF